MSFLLRVTIVIIGLVCVGWQSEDGISYEGRYLRCAEYTEGHGLPTFRFIHK